MAYKMHTPVDDSCPVVEKFHSSLYDDPMSAICGCLDEIVTDWEKKHRANCAQCREFGCANIEVREE